MMAEVLSVEVHWNVRVLAFSADLHSEQGPAMQCEKSGALHEQVGSVYLHTT